MGEALRISKVREDLLDTYDSASLRGLVPVDWGRSGGGQAVLDRSEDGCHAQRGD